MSLQDRFPTKGTSMNIQELRDLYAAMIPGSKITIEYSKGAPDPLDALPGAEAEGPRDPMRVYDRELSSKRALAHLKAQHQLRAQTHTVVVHAEPHLHDGTCPQQELARGNGKTLEEACGAAVSKALRALIGDRLGLLAEPIVQDGGK